MGRRYKKMRLWRWVPAPTSVSRLHPGSHNQKCTIASVHQIKNTRHFRKTCQVSPPRKVRPNMDKCFRTTQYRSVGCNGMKALHQSCLRHTGWWGISGRRYVNPVQHLTRWQFAIHLNFAAAQWARAVEQDRAACRLSRSQRCIRQGRHRCPERALRAG